MAQQLILPTDSLKSGRHKVNDNFTELFTEPAPSTGIILPKESDAGIKTDALDPTFTWQDLRGVLYPAERWQTDTPRTDVPVLAAFRGTISKDLAFKANDKIDRLNFHIPHDYVLGSDIFIHMHWGQNGTSIAGSFVVDYYINYAKGHQQALFSAEIDVTQTISTPDVASIPQWQHLISEIPLSTPGGGPALLDTNLLEPDGLILTGIVATTIPTITGSASQNLPFIFEVDIHYLSRSYGTKQKAPPFYV